MPVGKLNLDVDILEGLVPSKWGSHLDSFVALRFYLVSDGC